MSDGHSNSRQISGTPATMHPRTRALLRQIRLERVLERYGYMAAIKPTPCADITTVPAKPIISLPRPVKPKYLDAHQDSVGSRNEQTLSKVRSAKRRQILGCAHGKMLPSTTELTHIDQQHQLVYKPLAFFPLRPQPKLPTLQRQILQSKTRDKSQVYPAGLKQRQSTIEVIEQFHSRTSVEELKKRIKLNLKKVELEFKEQEQNENDLNTELDCDMDTLPPYRLTRDAQIVENYERAKLSTNITRTVQERCENIHILDMHLD